MIWYKLRLNYFLQTFYRVDETTDLVYSISKAIGPVSSRFVNNFNFITYMDYLLRHFLQDILVYVCSYSWMTAYHNVKNSCMQTWWYGMHGAMSWSSSNGSLFTCHIVYVNLTVAPSNTAGSSSVMRMKDLYNAFVLLRNSCTQAAHSRAYIFAHSMFEILLPCVLQLATSFNSW